MISVAVPRFIDEADMNDPRQALVPFISGWPKVGESRPYPQAPDPLLPYHSEFLTALGLVYDPSRATIKKVRCAEAPGWKFVPVDEPDPVVEVTVGDPADEALSLLRDVDPVFAKHIEGLNDEQRAAELKSRFDEFQKAMAVIESLRSAGAE